MFFPTKNELFNNVTKMRLFDRFSNTARRRKKLQLLSSDHNDFLFQLWKQGDGRTVTIV